MKIILYKDWRRIDVFLTFSKLFIDYYFYNWLKTFFLQVPNLLLQFPKDKVK